METRITDKIKSFEDAMAATGRPALPAFADVHEDMREYFQAHYKMAVIAEALNEGWKADWNDDNQRKYYPWFYNDGGLFGLRVRRYGLRLLDCGRGLRLSPLLQIGRVGRIRGA